MILLALAMILQTPTPAPTNTKSSTTATPTEAPKGPALPADLVMEFYQLQLKGMQQREELTKTPQYSALEKTTGEINENVKKLQTACGGDYNVAIDKDNKPFCAAAQKDVNKNLGKK